MAVKYGYNSMLQQKFGHLITNAKILAGRRDNLVKYLGNYIAGRMDEKGDLVLNKVRDYSFIRRASLKKLHYMGHPYARRHFGKKFKKGRPALPALPYLINFQSGKLYAGWRKTKGFANKRHQAAYVKIYNIKKHSTVIKGTKRMIKRPIVETAVKRVEKTTTPLSVQISKFVNAVLQDKRFVN